MLIRQQHHHRKCRRQVLQVRTRVQPVLPRLIAILLKLRFKLNLVRLLLLFIVDRLLRLLTPGRLLLLRPCLFRRRRSPPRQIRPLLREASKSTKRQANRLCLLLLAQPRRPTLIRWLAKDRCRRKVRWQSKHVCSRKRNATLRDCHHVLLKHHNNQHNCKPGP